MYVVSFDLHVVVFNIRFGSFGALSSKWPVSQKLPGSRLKQIGVGDSGLVVHIWCSVHFVVFMVICVIQCNACYLGTSVQSSGVTYCCRQAERQGPLTSCFLWAQLCRVTATFHSVTWQHTPRTEKVYCPSVYTEEPGNSGHPLDCEKVSWILR